jgi:hypothetical protein
MNCNCKNYNNCCKCFFTNIPSKPLNNDLKTVALLELSSGVNDIPVKETMEYYFINNSNIFKSFPIVDTQGTLEKTIQLLDLYYNLGYRIFIGFIRSSILKNVLPWFESHPLAIGISINSTSPTLSIPKNVYRLTPSDDNILNNIKLTPYFSKRKNIFYVYSQGEEATEYVLAALLNPLSPIKNKIIPIPILPDSSNINDVMTIYKSKNYNPLTDATIEYLFLGNQRYDFINLFSPSFIPVPTFDISLNTFPILDDVQEILWNNLYYSYQNINISTSPIWRKGYNTLGGEKYSTVTLNSLQLNNILKNKTDTNELSNYAFVQQFNENKDIIYFSYSGYVIKNKIWTPESVIINDPIFGYVFKGLI